MEIRRIKYLEQIKEWKDKHFIKILTGIRRSGKSTILSQLKNELQKENNKDNFIEINFNDLEFAKMSYEQLHKFILQKSTNSNNYLFLDEIQEIDKWEKTIISLFENKTFKYDIYLTGSNSKMLSSELGTYFTGRNKTFHIYPFSFKELYDNSLLSDNKKDLEKYMNNGGLGIIINDYNNGKHVNSILSNIFIDTIDKDVKHRHNIKISREIHNIINYAYSQVGSKISTVNLSNYLKSNKEHKIAPRTINNYLKWACDSLLLVRVDYFRPKGMKILETTGKYYAGDLGLLSSVNPTENYGFKLENLVLLELLDRGYEVYTYRSKLGKEVDFVCLKDNKITYVQVTKELNDENYNREIGNLLSIKDAFPKIVLYLENNETTKIDGVERKNIIDWLLKK